MFKIECYCDDKHVATILRSLAGIAMQVQAVPVLNAMADKANGKIKAQYTGDELGKMLVARLHKKGMRTFHASDVKEFFREVGHPLSSYSHFLNRMRDQGMLKSTKSKEKMGFDWHIVEPKS